MLGGPGEGGRTEGARVLGSTTGELSTMLIMYATPAAAPAGSLSCTARAHARLQGCGLQPVPGLDTLQASLSAAGLSVAARGQGFKAAPILRAYKI